MFLSDEESLFLQKNGFKQPCLIYFFFAIFAEDLLHSAI